MSKETLNRNRNHIQQQPYQLNDHRRPKQQLVTTIFVNNSSPPPPPETIRTNKQHVSTLITLSTPPNSTPATSASISLDDENHTALTHHLTTATLSRSNSSSSISLSSLPASSSSLSSSDPLTETTATTTATTTAKFQNPVVKTMNTSMNQNSLGRTHKHPTFIINNGMTSLKRMSPTIPISSAFVGKHGGHRGERTNKNQHKHRMMTTMDNGGEKDQNHHHMIVVHGPPDQMVNMSPSQLLMDNNYSYNTGGQIEHQKTNQQLLAMNKSNKLSLLSDSIHHQRERPIVSEYASVLIRDLHYEVGRGRHKKIILDSINLTVPEGSIYGLLGPSGCGKTTMLRCTVGRLKPKRGSLLVFGYKPNDSECQIPGRAVGYMPQEISIYEDFTIEETLKYFGKINRMKTNCIKQRIEFLLSFLDLPTKKRLVANLSGGQKRRVSLAAALVHSPPLLILDEPTVGVDPLLRQSIWEHLVTLTKTEKISVIITTHYIEEARQANVVGLMRHGKILAENSPELLMSTYNLNSLEDVFLKLCVTDSSRRAATMATSASQHKAINSMSNNLTTTIDNQQHLQLRSRKGLTSEREDETSYMKQTDDHHHMMAFTNDALIRSDDEFETSLQANNISDATTTIISNGSNEVTTDSSRPTTVTTSMTDQYSTNTQLIKWAGRRADKNGFERGKKMNNGLNNNESKNDGPFTQWWKTLMAVTWKNFVRLKRNPPVLIFQFIVPAIQVILFCSCIGGEPFDVPVAIVNDEVIPQSSQLFLNGLDRKIVRQIKYNNLSSAIEAVKRGKAWGVIHIPDRYSQNLQSRLILGDEVTNDTISNGTIRVYPDLTNLHLALALETTLRETFISFARDSLENLGYDRSLADLPIQVAKPIYGTMKKDGYLEFMAPGVVISISYVMATGLTALAFILERRDGLLERSLVSGVQTSQILLAHAINQVVVMTIQIFLVLACTFFVFEIPSRGPFVWVVLLILLQGCTGMSFGLLVSALCEEENTAVMMLVGTFYTNLILAGIIWPIEAMPHWLRPLSYAQPQTLPTETLRHILSRGWGIDEPGVLAGFAVTIGWLVAFLLAAGMIFKYSK